MTAPTVMNMIWDALEMLAVQRRGDHLRPRPIRMKQEGTMAMPEIIFDVVDPALGPDKQTWKISEKGLEKLTP